MRTKLSLNEGWSFWKDCRDITAREGGESVTLPHTWNALDGQDGGNDYFRGTCLYKRSLSRQSLPEGDRYYLEFCGANSGATVYVNGEKLSVHDGGYSTFRVDITDALADTTELAVLVDNAPNDRVYPQMADFTFYGGLYRGVNLIAVPEKHFDLDYYGAPGLAVTPEVNGKGATVTVETYLSADPVFEGADAPEECPTPNEGQSILYTIYDKEGNVVAEASSTETKVSFLLENAHLWHGRRDPYLYTAKAALLTGDEVTDEISARFGIRSFRVDPERGFILNGEEYPLRGVSRHQDRLGIGNALLPEHHEEDMALILELGATTIRLAHYQHDQYFYDLCDENGLVIWAEIPYISKHMPAGTQNTVQQMTELIAQNYNHASICFWGLSNEISIAGSSEDLLENHRILNELCHRMDKTRLTTLAAVSMCKTTDPYLQIPDLVSYNHYFGWYGGETDMNGPWFDRFHEEHPTLPIGISEYGAEALNWHTSNPVQGDYTEEYQAYYHEELIRQLFSRPYIWATHVWNMFDFGADARSEGGENGQNHKGLVTMDRKYKKDAFFAYKAHLSSEPFVHIAGKRYVDRVEDVTTVTVYSNLEEVELFLNGESLGKKTAPDHFFRFSVPNAGESTLLARAGDCEDTATLRKVDTMNEAYLLKEAGAVLNWFDVTSPEGRYSLNDKVSDIMQSLFGKLWFLKLALKLKKKMKASSASAPEGEGAGEKGKKKGMSAMGFELSEDMMKMMGGFTVLRLSSMMGMANISFTKEELLALNRQLNRIKKPRKLRG